MELKPIYETASPGGGNTIKSAGIFFIYSCIINWQEDTKYICTIRDIKAKKNFYLLENSQEDFCHPISGELIHIQNSWKLMRRNKFKVLLDRIKNQLYYRTLLRPDRKIAGTISVNAVSISKEGEKCSPYYNNFLNSLTHRLTTDKDLLLKEVHNMLPQIKENLKLQLEDKSGYHCPIDGKVTPLLLVNRSPKNTWKMMCGREEQAYVCPHCLYELQQIAVMMN